MPIIGGVPIGGGPISGGPRSGRGSGAVEQINLHGVHEGTITLSAKREYTIRLHALHVDQSDLKAAA